MRVKADEESEVKQGTVVVIDCLRFIFEVKFTDGDRPVCSGEVYYLKLSVRD